MNIAKHAAALALSEATSRMVDAVHVGDAMDGWAATKDVAKNGRQAAKQVRQYVGKIAEAVEYFERCLKHYESIP